MKRFLILATAFVVTLGVAVVASVKVLNAIERRSTTTTYSMQVGGTTRQYDVIMPTATLAKKAPIIVMLSGIAASAAQEIVRDHLVPYADADKAEIVYPVSIRDSWNLGKCCGTAMKLHIDDVPFLEALIPKIDPGHARPIWVAGYSNGGRMAYQLECDDPGLFDGLLAVKADPEPGCEVTKPDNVLVVSAVDDPWVPFKAGEKGKETPPASVQIVRLQKNLGCPSKSVTTTHGDMYTTTWKCAHGKRLEWAVYSIGGHNFAPPTAHSPSASQLVWSFVSNTPVAPLPT